MRLPKGFQFSQGSLQDYVDCARRFFLRYVQRLAWPAVESEPILESEHYAQLGEQFHKMIQQHLIGVPAEKISAMITAEELREWWENYLEYYRQQAMANQTQLFPEIILSAPIGNHRLMAKFDLISLQKDGSLVITDWKTARKPPQRIWLERRLQTRVYPYLLSKAGDFLNNNHPIYPEQIRMIYWFANFPDQPEVFSYDRKTMKADQERLEYLVEAIEMGDEKAFHLTDDKKHCQFCVYRSLCGRGIQASNLDTDEESVEDITSFDDRLDIDQIAEIEY
ncbi:MAG: PD-(D/E)XK nuclease family protein [Anaerolineales bacterium]|nr:PD-(D/E)XK nuclease family protein [Anaerolineales bacterium]